MKLLLDENISRRIVPHLQETFPGTSHVALIGLERATDREIWNFAHLHDFSIVTNDADFEALSLQLRPPPSVVRLMGGNRSSPKTLRLLLDQANRIVQEIEAGTAIVNVLQRRA